MTPVIVEYKPDIRVAMLHSLFDTLSALLGGTLYWVSKGA